MESESTSNAESDSESNSATDSRSDLGSDSDTANDSIGLRLEGGVRVGVGLGLEVDSMSASVSDDKVSHNHDGQNIIAKYRLNPNLVQF